MALHDGEVKISGLVQGWQNSHRQAPIKGARVRVPAVEKQVETHRDGRFSLWVPSGHVTYAVVAEANGYGRREVMVSARADIQVDFLLVRR